MDGRQRLLVEVLLVVSFIFSVILIFFPSMTPLGRRLSIFYVGSPIYPYARIIFPILTIVFYILRKKYKDELTDEQIQKLWKKRDK